MSTQVQFRRGTTTQNNAFTGAVGELSVDTDLKTLRLHDGTTAGGGSVMLNNVSAQTALNKTFSTGSVWQGTAVGLGYGGTGSALTATAGAVAYSTATGLALSASGTSGQVLVSGGTNAPTWVAASSISAGTATLATTATNIAGGSAGQLIIQADTGLSTFITAGASGTFLRSAGAGYAPTWATADVTIGSTVISLGSSSTSLAGLDIIAATGTSHWKIPVGTTAQRPGTPAVGMIRYNSTQSTFEGYSSGAWSSLGGVKSVDALTYIIAETSAGASNGDLDFYAEDAAGTAATQVGQWNRTNLKDYTGTLVGTQTTQNVFNATATTINAFGAATAITLGATTGTATLRNATISLPNATAITTGQTTVALLNTTATTINAFGAATTLSLGASSGTTTVNNNLVVTGNFTVNGTTETINATTIQVADKNIELGVTGSPTNTTASGGGITLKGATDKTISWTAATGWQLDEDIATSRYFTLTTAGATANAMLAISSTTYRSGKLVVQVVNGTAYRIMEMLFMHDGTTVTFNENYTIANEMQSAATNTTFSGSISAGTLTIYATCSSGTAAIKGQATLFKV